MGPVTRISQPEEIGRVLQREYPDVRIEIAGDPEGDSGATLFVWARSERQKDELRARAAELCENVYVHGFYVVPIVLLQEDERTPR